MLLMRDLGWLQATPGFAHFLGRFSGPYCKRLKTATKLE